MPAAISSLSAVYSNYKKNKHLNKMSTVGTKIINVMKTIPLGDINKLFGLTQFSGGLKG